MQTNFIITLKQTQELDRMHTILILRGLGIESRSSFQDFRSFSQRIKVLEVLAVKGSIQSYGKLPSEYFGFRYLSLFLAKQEVSLTLASLLCTPGIRLPYQGRHQLLLEILPVS